MGPKGGKIWSKCNIIYPNEVTAVGHISPVMKTILKFDQILAIEIMKCLICFAITMADFIQLKFEGKILPVKNKETVISENNLSDKISRTKYVGQNM